LVAEPEAFATNVTTVELELAETGELESELNALAKLLAIVAPVLADP
jgi:hypothetical protein